MATSLAGKSNVLNSWKEIAKYLDRGVRTVQRWEHDLAMPVRRPRGDSRSPVVAIPEEIEAWLRTTPVRELSRSAEPAQPSPLSQLQVSVQNSQELRQRCEVLRNQHYLALAHLVDQLEVMTVSISDLHTRNDLRSRSGIGQGFRPLAVHPKSYKTRANGIATGRTRDSLF